MAKLILSTDGEVVDEFELDKDVVRIGRQEDNEITIDCLSVSNYHTRLMIIGGDTFIEDMGSTNGTYVNTDKITRGCLEDGDILTLGSHNLKFDASTSVGQDSSEKHNGATQVVEDSPHMVIRDGAHDANITLNGGMTTFGKTGEHVAAVTKRHDGYYCLHVDGGESQSATLLNGSPVPSEGKQLKEHDVVEVAGIELEFIG